MITIRINDDNNLSGLEIPCCKIQICFKGILKHKIWSKLITSIFISTAMKTIKSTTKMNAER